MNLTLADGTSFTLTIIGYQYPQLATEPYDSNWLLIRIDASNSRASWSATDPCLLTYEVSQLADWLEALATGADTKTTCSFIEPNLHFQVIEDSINNRELRIYSECERQSSWTQTKHLGQEAFCLSFPLTQIDLLAAVSMLRQQLTRYPQRAD